MLYTVETPARNVHHGALTVTVEAATEVAAVSVARPALEAARGARAYSFRVRAA